MSVLIKNMEMPKNCKKCMFADFDDVEFDYELYCAVSKKYADLDACDRPLGWACPLTEVKEPHGRLGDLDKLKYEIVVGNQKYLGLNEPCLEDVTPIENVDDCIDAIAFAPTIVEAEGSKDEHR